eukprot:TRINITY_DN36281_c0_g1_i2.p1 TRINITY_DN36281_c0_g1~~TRINITY_DN36281_c0_g1_i2.p1  ORF type:complete len:164 (-),score=8.21 TRINITY_DN36281_c0_g1_i2:10-501(-)
MQHERIRHRSLCPESKMTTRADEDGRSFIENVQHAKDMVSKYYSNPEFGSADSSWKFLQDLLTSGDPATRHFGLQALQNATEGIPQSMPQEKLRILLADTLCSIAVSDEAASNRYIAALLLARVSLVLRKLKKKKKKKKKTPRKNTNTKNKTNSTPKKELRHT